jgi:predicted GNAT family N-acyltransferase
MRIEPVRVWRADWTADRAAIEHIRRMVFIEEQKVPIELEWDGLDAGAVHVLGSLNEEIAGTGRLLADGRVGRLAVLGRRTSPWTGQCAAGTARRLCR